MALISSAIPTYDVGDHRRVFDACRLYREIDLVQWRWRIVATRGVLGFGEIIIDHEFNLRRSSCADSDALNDRQCDSKSYQESEQPTVLIG